MDHATPALQSGASYYGVLLNTRNTWPNVSSWLALVYNSGSSFQAPDTGMRISKKTKQYFLSLRSDPTLPPPPLPHHLNVGQHCYNGFLPPSLCVFLLSVRQAEALPFLSGRTGGDKFQQQQKRAWFSPVLILYCIYCYLCFSE